MKEEEDEEDDIKQLMEEFEESNISTNLMYSQFSPQKPNEMHSYMEISSWKLIKL